MVDYVTISHDPFARISIMRKRVNRPEPCTFCGSLARFRYAIQRDDSHAYPQFSQKAYCGIGCWRIHY